MYIRSYHREPDPSVIRQFIQDHPFAVLVSCGGSYPAASHIPIEVLDQPEGGILLMGHIARANPQLEQISLHREVLVIFQGPQCYVSASWYLDPGVASTWNYLAVHASGKISLVDETATLAHLRRLTDRHESISEHPTSVDRMPEEYITKNLQAIAGFEIRVERLDNTWKLSQNKDQQTRDRIISELLKIPDPNARAIASEMSGRESLGQE
ncbi:MAG TPA: FMN-binding negative transcriptional regulator [Chitinophagaceae bacterium]|nr:FMN-binding negative transcriptional regulator [Chitinophagaceae bacterium]